MSSFRIRPRFQKTIHLSPEELRAGLKARQEQTKNECIVHSTTGYVSIHIPRGEQHFWSPQLQMTLEEQEDGTLIRGLYGPNPSVWTIFLFGYAALAILGFFAAMMGLSQLSLDMEPYMLWALPIMGLLAGLLYIIAQMGQKFGAEQMFTIHHFFEEVIKEKVHIS